MVARQPAGRGQEIAVGILGIDPALDGPAGQRHVGLRQVELFAGRHPNHLLDQIDAGDELGHRMLDLKTGVHLEKEEGAVLGGDELDGAGRIVMHRLGQGDRLGAHAGPGRGVEQWRGRLLDHLLVPALDRTFALAEMDDVAVLVAQHLDLDMARIDDEFLDEHPIVAEGRQGLGAGTGEAVANLDGGMGDPHALAAAAGRSLDHHRIADVGGDLHRLVLVGNDAEMAGDGRYAGASRRPLRFDLVAHRLDGGRIRPDENDAGAGQRLRQRRRARRGSHSPDEPPRRRSCGTPR